MVLALSYTPLVRIEVIGDLAISPHGILTVVGFLVAAWFFLRDSRRLGVPDEVMTSVLLRAALGALVGARFFYVLNNLSDFSSPLEWFEIWEGGISLLGGLAGALAVSWWEARRRRLDFVGLFDHAAVWLPLGIAIGRIGDVVIADHLGRTTSSPLGFRCPEFPDIGRNVGSACPPGELVHLTAAYDLVVSLAVFGLLLLFRHRRTVLRRGEQSLMLAVLYGTNRFALDFFREDLRRFGLTGSQWAALAVVVVAGVLLMRLWRAPSQGEEDADGEETASAETLP